METVTAPVNPQPTLLPDVKFPVTLKIRDVEYTINQLSGFRYMKIYGDGNKLTRDVYKELISAAVTSPAITPEAAEELPYDVFIFLAENIYELHQASLKNLHGSVPSPLSQKSS